MKFIFFVEGGTPKMNPADATRQLEIWLNWLKALKEKGVLESSAPFTEDIIQLSAAGAVTTTMKPIDISGYLIVNTASRDEALSIAKQAPNISRGGFITIRECFDIKPDTN